VALFEARHIAKRFGDRIVLQDVSLAFDAGRLSGIIGPNGAGKTTCFNVLTGRYAPDRGSVVFDGEDITGSTPAAIARKGLSRSFQSMNLFDDYSAADNVMMALPELRSRGFDVLHDLARDSACADRAEQVLAQVGLAGKERTTATPWAAEARKRLEALSKPTPAAAWSTWRISGRFRSSTHGPSTSAERRSRGLLWM